MKDDDIVSNRSNNPSFEEIIEARLSRRGFLGGGLATAATVALGGVSALLKAVPAAAQKHGEPPPRISRAWPCRPPTRSWCRQDTRLKCSIAWGDPVSDGPAFKPDASNSAADQALQWGMHNDGVVYFPIDGSSRGLLVQNNEYTDDGLLFTDGIANWSAEKTNKSSQCPWRVDRRDRQATAVRTTKTARTPNGGEWRVVRPSKYARRITGQTPIEIGGPAAGDDRLKTSADPTGKLVLGTLNNCAMGFTPWGTYLACEENFNGLLPEDRSLTARHAGTPLRHLPLRFGLPAVTPPTRGSTPIPSPMNRTGSAGWWRSIRSIPNRHRSSALPSAASSMKARGCRRPRTARLSSIWATTSATNISTDTSRTCRGGRRAERGSTPWTTAFSTSPRFNADGTGEWLPLTPAMSRRRRPSDGLVAERHSNQHPRRSRCGRRDDDGSP